MQTSDYNHPPIRIFCILNTPLNIKQTIIRKQLKSKKYVFTVYYAQIAKMKITVNCLLVKLTVEQDYTTYALYSNGLRPFSLSYRHL